jgi:hypothetical protein
MLLKNLVTNNREFSTGDLIYFLPNPYAKEDFVNVQSFIMGNKRLFLTNTDIQSNNNLRSILFKLKERISMIDKNYTYCIFNGMVRIYQFGFKVKQILKNEQDAYNAVHLSRKAFEEMLWSFQPKLALSIHVNHMSIYGGETLPSFENSKIIPIDSVAFDPSVLSGVPDITDLNQANLWYKNTDVIVDYLIKHNEQDAVQKFKEVVLDFKKRNPILFRKDKITSIFEE